MSYLFSSPPASYAQEQLHSHLSSLSTLPVSVPKTQSVPDKPSAHLESALHELSSSRPPTQTKLKDILKSLADVDERNDRFSVQSEIDRVVEREIMGRAVTIVWQEVLDDLMKAAMELEAEKGWWDGVLTSRTGVSIYLLQSKHCLPLNKALLTPSLASPNHCGSSTSLFSIFAHF
jgi:nuclear-control-of-ATPase protein 2